LPPGDDDLDLIAARRRLRRRPSPRYGLRFGLVLLLLVPLVLAGLVAGGVWGASAYVNSSCSLKSLRPLRLGANTFVFASDRTLLGSIPSSQNRQPLSLRQIAKWVPLATVAIEDRRFWQHGALDYMGIARAAWKDLLQGTFVQGGSTITQQLARNLYIGNDQQKLHRKVVEACLAIKLEERYTKRQILDDYLNTVYYGNHAFGIEAAAQTYFSRHAFELTLPQAALLAGLPQAPSVYDPLQDADAALGRRNEVLAAMLAAGDIKPAAYTWATRARLRLQPTTIYTRIRLPYFFSYVESQLVKQYGADAVRAGGLRVRTTIEPRLQALAERAQKDVLLHRDDPSSALVAIDPRNGDVKAMAVDVPDGRRLQFNLASQGHRTAGSAFKPFVLATAMTQGVSLYSSFSGPSSLTIPDRRCEGVNGPWDVHNFADESSGTMDLVNATAHSVNTIFAQLVTRVGPENVVTTAHRMGIRSRLLPVCSITLGSQPVSPLEMADAYATFAARGIHHAPQSLAEVKLSNGHVDRPSAGKAARALPQDAADKVVYALQAVVKYGTGTAAALSDRPVAGKTGTAENFQDAWFCGFVPQLATCVWVGYPRAEIPLENVEGLSGVFGGSLPAQIWHEFMSGATAGMPVLDFAQPDLSGSSDYYSSSSSGTDTSTSSSDTSTSSSGTSSPPPPPPTGPRTVTVVPPPPEPQPRPQPSSPGNGHGHAYGRGKH
jgi:penicillin-binding protein 1A